jgi:hypothetical protein
LTLLLPTLLQPLTLLLPTLLQPSTLLLPTLLQPLTLLLPMLLPLLQLMLLLLLLKAKRSNNFFTLSYKKTAGANRRFFFGLTFIMNIYSRLIPA